MFFCLALACQNYVEESRFRSLEIKVDAQQKRIEELERKQRQSDKAETSAKGCTQFGVGRYRLSRGLMKSYAKQEERLPRALPYQVGGVLQGIRLAEVSKIWESCGFLNGDVGCKMTR